MRTTFLLSLLLGIWLPLQAASVSGELRKWHKVTLSFNGPSTSETATPNPFTNYRLDVTFRHAGSGKSYVVPGYYAADGDSADTCADSGNVWLAHFAPDETGTWTYEASFRSGANVYAGSVGSGGSAGFFDGDSGNFSVADTNKNGRDFRGKGRLQYVGKHHLRFAGTGDYFMKAGVDSPENLLSYADFDGDFKTDGEDDDLVKDYQPHVGDWRSGDPVWQGSKGKGLIGAINYLASEGLNSISFLTLNIEGDDKNVFMYTDYDSRDRLDVSRLGQWEIVFEHGTKNGMYLHFKTQETENELLLDGGNVGNQRKLYYRELVARFGHHLALNWNLGEEINDASTSQKKAWAQYFHDIDPYDHHIVIHNGDGHFDLMGPDFELTGMSWQANASNFSDTFTNVLRYIDNSVDEGKPWVVACDEPGDARLSLRPDNDAGNSHTDARRDALWATIMAGGAGIEFYFGYDKPNSDLTCEDFRSRDSFWDYCRYALQLFESGAVPFQDMSNANSLVSSSGTNGNRCLAKPGQYYLVQLRSGGTHTLNLSGVSGSFRVRWLDPRNGGTLVNGNVVNGGGTVSLGSPPNSTTQDWIALVESTTGGTPDNQAPVVSAGPDRTGVLETSSVTLTLSGSASDDGLPESGSLTTGWTRVSGPAGVSFSTPTSSSTQATFSATGTYVLRLTAGDGEFTRTDDVTVTITPPAGGGGETLTFDAIHDAYTENGTNRNLPSIRIESSSRKRIAYLQFDVQGIASASSAILKLTESDDDSGGTMTLRLYAAASNNWTETTITGSNAPAKGPPVAVFTGTIGNGQEASFDVSSLVTGSGIYSVIIEADSSSRDIAFGSAEYATVAARPKLVITSGGSGPVNAAPVVNAGNDQSATLAGSSAQVSLNGTASDDGLPSGSSLAVTWTRVSGPAAVSFSAPNSPATQATFTQAGSYVLRLTATDGALTRTDDVAVTINSQTPTNQPPVVSAGADRTATLSGGQVSLAIDGSANDDGLPSGSSLTVAWTRVSGPGSVAFSTPSSQDTNATFTVAGTYVLRLSSSDGTLTASDTATVVINSAPIGGGTPTAFQATHDAFTENGSTRNSTNLRLENTSRKRIAYLQFDLTTAAEPISTATLTLTEDDDVSSGPMTLRLFAATSNSWTESTITGSNAPAKGAQLAVVTGEIENNEKVSFDVSALVTAPGIYSFILESDPSSYDVALASSENSTVSARPVLRITSGSAAAATLAAPGDEAGTSDAVEPAPAIGMQRMAGGSLRIGIVGVPGRTYRVQRTTDLVRWETMKTTVATEEGIVDFIDDAPPEPSAFYRLEWDD
ncbi:DNRLRE domain-containing protein [Luteolibacter arcticus]|uniref:DNRLRE domain-containing protein n=1 Tax=Luteolibacter arcticus TaxID=1581411 RepID=A0ABT3GBQ4_9BACT|nr:DNRLRE domain-containing protein [Luteolibacter arcticus]MCW1921004.1 DNRLRE domain-containing protein [Luteolibacter arcticus]